MTEQMHLKNAARSWFLSRSESFSRWYDFRDVFVLAFAPEVNKSQLWDNLKNRRQRDGKYCHDYYYDKAKLCISLDLEFENKWQRVR